MTVEHIRETLVAMRPSKLDVIGEAVVAVLILALLTASIWYYGDESLPPALLIPFAAIMGSSLGRFSIQLRYRRVIGKHLENLAEPHNGVQSQ